jgi:hypothetical protein
MKGAKNPANAALLAGIFAMEEPGDRFAFAIAVAAGHPICPRDQPCFQSPRMGWLMRSLRGSGVTMR